MVLVGVFSFSAFLVLSAYAPDLRSGSDGGAHALSKSAIGFAGLAELLSEEGAPVVISRGQPPHGAGQAGVLVLTPTSLTDLKQLQALRYDGAILVVLPKWIAAPSPLHAGWVQKVDLLPLADAAAPLGGASKSVSIARRKGVASPVLKLSPTATGDRAPLPLGRIESLQTISGPDLDPVILDEQGKAVLAQFKSTAVFVLADPDLMNTQGIGDVHTAWAAHEVLDHLRGGKGPVIFDVTLNGFKRARSVLRLALEPPILGATLCLAFAAALMGLHAAFRFGPPRRSTRSLALGKRALADNAAALVRMARREPRMAEAYAALSREAAATAAGAPRNLGPRPTDELLDRLGAGRGATVSFSQLMAEAQAVKTNADLMASARRLYQWTQEMTRARR
jgi:hypothetical protein